MNDNERLDFYRQLSPMQLAAKKHQCLKEGLMFRALKKQTGDKRWDELADRCFLDYGLVAQVAREGQGSW